MWINRENILWIILIRQQRSGKWHNFSSDANRNQSLVRRLSEPKQSETTSVKCKAHDTIRFLYFKNRLYSSCFETIFVPRPVLVLENIRWMSGFCFFNILCFATLLTDPNLLSLMKRSKVCLLSFISKIIDPPHDWVEAGTVCLDSVFKNRFQTASFLIQ